MSGAAVVITQVRPRVDGNKRRSVEIPPPSQGCCEDNRHRVVGGSLGDDSVFVDKDDDSQDGSGEAVRDFGDLERGEGSGESEIDAPIGDGRNSSTSVDDENEPIELELAEEREPIELEDDEAEEREVIEEEVEEREPIELELTQEIEPIELEEEEESEHEEDEENGGGRENRPNQVPIRNHVRPHQTIMPESSVRDITREERGTQCEGGRGGDLLFRRVSQLSSHSASYPPTPYTPTPSLHHYSSRAHHQWLLELTLALLVTILLVTICSRLSYNWLLRLYTIHPERPI